MRFVMSFISRVHVLISALSSQKQPQTYPHRTEERAAEVRAVRDLRGLRPLQHAVVMVRARVGVGVRVSEP